MEEFLIFISEYWAYLIAGLFLLFAIIGICIANFSYDHYLKSFDEMNKISTRFKADAYSFAKKFSVFFFKGQIAVEVLPEKEMPSSGSYTPARKTVSLSSQIAYIGSIASFAIVAHEFGHSFQHKNNPKILVQNFKLAKTVKFLGFLNVLLVIAGVYFFATGVIIVCLFFLLFMLLNFIVAIWLKISTLKLEKNASEIAMDLLQKTNVFSKKELSLMSKFLSSAKATYTGDLFRALFSWTGLVRKTKIF